MLIKRCFKVTIFIILVSAILTGTRIFLCSANEPYQATVEDLSGNKYFPAVKEALKDAKSSIYMAMYFVGFNPNNKESQIYALVEELVSAHKRGVKLKVILDQGIDFSGGERGVRRWEREQRNASLFAYLKQQGIDVYYDSLSTITHAKAIVIDEETVIVGSTNWSESSLQKNWETSCLIRSKELAQQFLKYFSQISIDRDFSDFDEERKSGVRLNPVFLKAPSLASRMLSAFDETGFDLYLFLLKNFDGNPEGKIGIDYKNITSSLGLDKRLSFVSSRDRLVRTLARLDERYQLIIRKKQAPKPPLVTLLNYPHKQPYALPQEGYFFIPQEYWLYGWDKLLSMPEKFCFLLNLYKTDIMRNPVWSSYMGDLTREFNISRSTLERGMQGLRKLNIIEIQYPEYPEKGGFAGRGISYIRLHKLYSPEVLKKEKDKISQLYGKGQFEEAQRYAEIIYKGNDIQAIEDIIKTIKEYGVAKVDRAFRIVSQMAPDNPKRIYEYVVGILETESGDKQ